MGSPTDQINQTTLDPKQGTENLLREHRDIELECIQWQFLNDTKHKCTKEITSRITENRGHFFE